jgi:GR25 family glycosyltransferase involved in LPS biosynthesis
MYFRMKIFVLHYSALTTRKEHIQKEFRRHNITDYEFIEKYDKDQLTEYERNMFSSDTKPSLMSLHLKHIHAYREIAEKYDNALIFEDDVILSNNFMEKLKIYLSQIPDDADLTFIGGSCNLHIEPYRLEPNKYIYEKGLYPTGWGGNGATRCVDSYIVSNKCAKRLCEYIDSMESKINLIVDFWLNMVARELELKVYWAEPTLVEQGSHTGLFTLSAF